MSIVFVTGNHPRHAFIARSLNDSGLLSGLIIENRESFIPPYPEEEPEIFKGLFEFHFRERERIESVFFGQVEWPDVNTLCVDTSELNGSEVHNFINNGGFKHLISYGCHLLNDKTLSLIKGECWNCHGGLSPKYKGTATHFWPSYMLEPQMTGMTIHKLSNRLDAGDIVHQCSSDLIRGDTLHMLAGRAVQKLGVELPLVLKKMIKLNNLTYKKQKGNGMLWLSKEWKPHHLSLIYDVHQDKIVDAYLDGRLSQKSPNLYRQDI